MIRWLTFGSLVLPLIPLSCGISELDLGSGSENSGGGAGGAEVIETSSSFALGSQHACARVSEKQIKCWGRNDLGQVGSLPETSHDDCGGIPCDYVPRTTWLEADVFSLDLGRRHSCLLDRNRDLHCFGGNQWGQLGRSLYDIDPHPAPELVLGDFGNVTSFAAGAYHTCFVASSKLYCFGLGALGQLGQDPEALAACLADPELSLELELDAAPLPCSTSPTQVFLDGPVDAVRAGDHFTCARVSGTWQCFGDNRRGQLGQQVVSKFEWEAEAIVFDQDVLHLAAGRSGLCVTSAGGLLYCAGDNNFGQLGSGSSPALDCETGACRASLLPVSQLSQVAASALSASTSCALHENGSVSCFGSDERGQLGNSSEEVETCSDLPCSPVPVSVYGLEGQSALRAGDDFFCVREGDGLIQCWGNGRFAQLTSYPEEGFSSHAGEAYGLKP